MGAGASVTLPDGSARELCALDGEAWPDHNLRNDVAGAVDFAFADPSLLSSDEIDIYLQNLAVPYRFDEASLIVASVNTGANSIARLRELFGQPVTVLSSDQRTLIAYIDRHFREHLSHDAVFTLADREPQFCARQTITPLQCAVLFGSTVCLGAGLLLQTHYAVLLLIALLALGFIANVSFRTMLVWVGAGKQTEKAANAEVISDDALPVYSILVPLYREAKVLPDLVRSLEQLNYPKEKLDIKLIVEEDDAETESAASALAVAAPFEIVRVPFSLPRTKPKACNYTLRFARGEYVVIFDAEDRPEPDQLRKAIAAFRAGPPDLGCVQACLNFFNASENWLTVLFSLDYSLWFDFLLPGLDSLRVPMPLGGTSNHFRTDILRAIHGWDAFNVTEDADLGIRLARKGYRASVLDSTTFEEATNRFPNWLRQRSRWIKGYMQTWLVHMRSPRALLRHAGGKGFLAFQLFIGGSVLSALINPLLWLITIFFYAFGAKFFGPDLASLLAHVSITSLIGGNAVFTYLAMLGPYRRGWHQLTPYGFLAPFYWLLISVAAYRALWQLITKPFHWEKTEHGTSTMSAEEAQS